MKLKRIEELQKQVSELRNKEIELIATNWEEYKKCRVQEDALTTEINTLWKTLINV